MSFTTPSPASSMSKATFERGSARQRGGRGLVEAVGGGPLGRERVPGVGEAPGGIGLEDHLFGVD